MISKPGYGELRIEEISFSEPVVLGEIPLFPYEELLGEWSGETGEHSMPTTIDNIDNGIVSFKTIKNCVLKFDKQGGVSTIEFLKISDCLNNRK